MRTIVGHGNSGENGKHQAGTNAGGTADDKALSGLQLAAGAHYGLFKDVAAYQADDVFVGEDIAVTVHQVGVLADDGTGKLGFHFLGKAHGGCQEDANHKKSLHF